MAEIRVQGGFPGGTVQVATPSLLNWTPALLGATLLAAWDANLGYTLATGVSSWTDASGNGHSLTQATGSAQPTLNTPDAQYNGQNTFSLLGSASQALTTPSGWTTTNQPYTVLIVGNTTAANGVNQRIFDDSSGTFVYAASSTADLGMDAGTILASTTVITSPTVMACQFNGATSGIFANSSQVAVASGAAGATALAGPIIGGEAAAYWTGKVAYAAVCNGVLSPANMRLFFTYLGHRYGIAVS